MTPIEFALLTNAIARLVAAVALLVRVLKCLRK